MSAIDMRPLDQEELFAVDDIVARNNRSPGGLIPVLQQVQTALGYLPGQALRRIAASLNMPEANVLGVATFYTQFSLTPKGEHIIRVCKGTACHVGGADRVSEKVQDTLGVNVGGTTADGKFTVTEVACLGCCSLAPVLMIDDEVHGRLQNTDKVPGILKTY